MLNLHLREEFCFEGKTAIHQPFGIKEIKDIKLGDKVLSFNHKLKKVIPNKVTKLFKRTTRSITKVFVAGSLLLATPEHPFFVNDSYVQAKDLQAGDTLVDYKGNLLSIDSVVSLDTTLTVYNFEVENAHTYFAGQPGVLVHNSCNLVRVAEKINNSTSKIAQYTQRLNRLNLDAASRSKLHGKLAEALTETEIVKFLDDIAESDDLIRSFVNNSELVGGWKRLIDAPYAIRKNTDLLDDVTSWPASWKLTKSGDNILVANSSGKQLGTIHSDKIVTQGRKVSGQTGNALLNRVPLVKNMKYDVDGFVYQTDELGRVVTTNADLDDIARIRLGNQQIKAVDVKDGVRGTDQGGHIIGSRFFGPGEQINLYPQSANLNQGAWKTMKNSWADAMVQGKDVKVKVTAVFDSASQRPTKFNVDYTIDGQPFREIFSNQ